MMRNIRISILIILIIASIAYSSLWFLSATTTKNNVLVALKYLKTEHKLDVAYESINLGGFPYKIKVFLEKPLVTMYKNSLEAGTITMPRLVIASDLLGTKYEFLDANDVKIDLKNTHYILDYNSSPILKIKFYHSPLFNQLTSGETRKWWHNLASVSYSDQGYKVVDNMDKIKYESVSSKFNINHNILPQKNLIDIELGMQDFSSNVNDQYAKFDFITNLGLEIIEDKPQGDTSTVYPYETIKFDVKKYNLISSNFKIEAIGGFQSTKVELMPVGKLNINIYNYNNFLDYLCVALKIEDREKFTTLLVDKIAVVTNEDLSITLDRKANDILYIGKMTMPEIATYYLGVNNP